MTDNTTSNTTHKAEADAGSGSAVIALDSLVLTIIGVFGGHLTAPASAS